MSDTSQIHFLRLTNTTLDVLNASRIDDSSNDDDDPMQSGIMDRLYSVLNVGRKEPEWTHVVWERLTKVQATSRPDYLWPDVWSDMSRSSQQKNSLGLLKKPKLDKTRELTGI